jgi:hypothetical protein
MLKPWVDSVGESANGFYGLRLLYSGQPIAGSESGSER